MTKLSVNINKIALIRNSRKGNNPSLEFFSKKIIESGAHGITVHPRPDLRHIRPDDLSDISLITKELDVEFNIEGNPYEERLGDYPGFLNLIDAVKPSQCTLVPDDSNQLTSDHGWNIHSEQNKLKDVLTYLKQNNIRSSVFIDPDISQLDAAKDIGVDRIEIYTGPFAEAFEKNDKEIHFEWIKQLLVNYYDKMYSYQLNQKKDRCIKSGDWAEVKQYILSST